MRYFLTTLAYFMDFEPRHLDSKQQRHLPHWQQTGATYFVTFRTADSISSDRLKQWKAARKQWLLDHPEPWDDIESRYYRINFPSRLNTWLDKGYGACHFQHSECRSVLESVLNFKDGDDYYLGDYVIMPNHVHVLVRPLLGCQLSPILKSWKGVSSRRVNQFIGEKGTLWMPEAFDHIVRNRERLGKFSTYIRDNPIKAGLDQGSYTLGKGKAQWEL